jgi:hypothetical protein
MPWPYVPINSRNIEESELHNETSFKGKIYTHKAA